ncbi:MAG TPA: phosphate ABC transporter permease subunit PstC [Thermomicrobiales bacterium]|nr:phosphate ABC transporter permease subunit PstC [Thermomicrobiales bacterium]
MATNPIVVGTGAPLGPGGSGEGQRLDLSGGHRGRRERLIGLALLVSAAISVFTTIGIILVLLEQAIEFFLRVPITEFLFGTTWTALFNNPQFGVLPLVAGTFWITAIALVVALPLGLMSAVYLSEYADHRVRNVVKPALELLAGVPTIVYGFFAVTFLRPQVLEPIFPSIGPFSALSAGIAVGVLIIPLVASLSEDAMRAVPRSLREGGYAMGATKHEVSWQVVVPAAFSGIVASFILAASRAVGETMIVALAGGNKAQLSGNPLEQMQTMTAYIVQVFSGDVAFQSTPYYSLFAVGLLLFVITLGLNLASQWLVTRFREVYE